MAPDPWPAAKWPEGVSHEISGYERPLFHILDDAAREYPDQVYTIFNGAIRTFSQVEDTANRIASFLVSRGLAKGDRVAIFLPNLPHYPAIFFGILKAGAVCVTCNPLYKAAELRFQLTDAGAKAVFCMDHPEFYRTAAEAVKGTEVETVVVCGVKSYLPRLTGIIGGILGKIPRAERHEPGHFLFDEVVSRSRPEPPTLTIEPSEDLALIIYTGGTSGVPKGAAMTHANFMFDIYACYEWVRLKQVSGEGPERYRKGGHNTFLGVLPWYHSFGLTLGMLTACFTASRMVCIPDPRAGRPPFTDVLKAVEKYKVTVMVAVPTIFAAFTNHPLIDSFDLSSIIGCGSGGAPLAVELARQFEERTGAIIFEGYGLSETAPVVCVNPTNATDRKFGSVGFPLPGTDVKILDVDEGNHEMPRGKDGEIAVHGPQVMKGYWNNPEADEAVFRDLGGRRYFLTGDIGHIDEEGYIVITDRKKDLIIAGGFNVYPREVEETLYEHPKVALAAVLGLPDERSGETVKAFVQLKPGMTATEEELLHWCRERMAGYKRPRAIEFRDSLPVSAVGKVLKRVLRDEQRKI